jgi:hypothetical protein
MKIAIIGGGLFGITTFLKLKSSGYDCILIEKEKKLMTGASTNNLNRLHLGYHYPRDDETAKQSSKGYKTFYDYYKSSVIKHFENYYLISKHNSLIDFKNYLKFCKRNNLAFKIIKEKNFFTQINKKFKNIQGIIKVKEPIYSWKLIIKLISYRLKKYKKKNIFTNSEVKDVIKQKKIYLIKTKKNVFQADIIIDASYLSLNYKFAKTTKIQNYLKKLNFQITIIPEIIIKNFKRLGLAVMDGPFFSILPKGKESKHLLYHVKYSVIKENKSLTKSIQNIKKSKYLDYFQKIRTRMAKDINYFLPEMKFAFTNKFYLSKRVIFKNKNDRRTSSVIELQKNYFLIASGKIDHSVDVANKMSRVIKKII